MIEKVPPDNKEISTALLLEILLVLGLNILWKIIYSKKIYYGRFQSALSFNAYTAVSVAACACMYLVECLDL